VCKQHALNKYNKVSMTNFLLAILAFFLPPLAVALKSGFHHDFCWNLLWCLLGWFPGIIHAWWVIFSKYPDRVPTLSHGATGTVSGSTAIGARPAYP
jgi:uncharacterized membrane protein YqaE (UPF0057 family)